MELKVYRDFFDQKSLSSLTYAARDMLNTEMTCDSPALVEKNGSIILGVYGAPFNKNPLRLF